MYTRLLKNYKSQGMLLSADLLQPDATAYFHCCSNKLKNGTKNLSFVKLRNFT